MATMTGTQLAEGLRERLAGRVVLQEHQIPPWRRQEPDENILGFAMMAGRGAGKSFAAMWELHTAMMETPNLRARVIAPTLGDGIAAAVDGPNGLLTLSKGQARWLPSAPGGACVRYPNGSRVWIVGTPTEVNVDRLRALTNCIAEGELVQTDQGLVPIEEVTTSHFVLTRAGYRKVMATWDRGVQDVFRVTAADGSSVVGTGDHPVLTENRGRMVLQELVPGDVLVTYQNSSTSTTTERGTTKAGASDTTVHETRLSTPPSMKTITDRSLRDTTSITSTTTGETTIRRTWSRSHEMFIGGTTHRSEENISRCCGTPGESGGIPTKVETTNANDVVGCSAHGTQDGSSVAPTVRRRTPESDTSRGIGTTLTRSASSVELRSERVGTTETGRSATTTSEPVLVHARRNWRTGIGQSLKTILGWGLRSRRHGQNDPTSTAPVSIVVTGFPTEAHERSSGAGDASGTEPVNVRTSAVVSVEPAGTSRVYDLSVCDDHEFFAGGVLVFNCDFDVFEELFANPCAQSAFRQAALSRRRGSRRWLVSSTPRPHSLIKEWEKDPRVEVRRGTSMDNKHIPLDWLHTLKTQYFGTRLYRQEVLGEVIEDVEGALWKANDIERSHVTGPASAVASICDRVVVGVDPPTGQGTCGIVVVGQDANGHMYVLDDRSVEEASPHVWAARVKEAADTYDAIVVAEINQGGQMVKEVLNSAGHALPLHTVSATKSKKTRAEPIALLWEVEEQIVHMVTRSTKLIDQMCEWVPGEGESPDRVDALVWACWFLRSRHTAEVRGATVNTGGPVSLPSALSSVRMGRY